MTPVLEPLGSASPRACTIRLASYAVCVRNRKILLVKVVDARDGSAVWTLPGGGIEPLEDPLSTVIREVAEETGATSRVLSILGTDSRVIPPHEAVRGVPHQNIGIFYEVEVPTAGLREEPSGDSAEPTWVPFDEVMSLPRSGLVDVGMRLFTERPPAGNVPPAEVGGLVRH